MVMRLINRREFVHGLALATALPMRPVFAQTEQVPAVLTAARVQSRLLGPESPPTEHFRFNLPEGQDVLRARQGEVFSGSIVNQLGEDLFLHFFGLRGPADVMTLQVPASEAAVEFSFTPPDAGTFWFGPLTQASRQRALGLAGMLIVEEREPLPLQDVPLVFDDWVIGSDGRIEEDFANLNRAAGEGRLGNWFTVNGGLKPRVTLDPEKPARLRLLNVANTRTMNIMFKGVEGMVLARDGQPVWPESIGLAALALAPGQSADLLLLEAQEQVVIALDLFEDVVEAAFLDAPGYGRKTLPRDFRLPLNPLPPLGVTLPPRAISLDIEGGLKGGLQSARVGKDVLDLRAMLEQGLAWSIGGNSGLGSPPLFEARTGETLLLTFDNKTAFEQPLHVHGHVWSPDAPANVEMEGPFQPMRWGHTLVIPPKTRASVVMVADNPGTWAIQSLMAERSDAGLIGAFTVSDMP